jgi:hypothetical protein
VIFRGAELDHFVSDWTGYRTFLLYTNHQPVRNHAHRKMGKLPPKPNDPWHPEQIRRAKEQESFVSSPPSEPDLEAYDPCYTEPMSPEPEDLYEVDIHGAGYIGKRKLLGSNSSSDTGNSESSKGELVVSKSPVAKRPRLDPQAQ